MKNEAEKDKSLTTILQFLLIKNKSRKFMFSYKFLDKQSYNKYHVFVTNKRETET